MTKEHNLSTTSNCGKFIVIDGTDGSGKATQTKLLADRLRLSGFAVEVADFPQYGQKSAGLVEEYLNGKYGSAEEVGPYRASIFFAVDRYDASFKIRKWLEEGKIVISNRYVTANMGHQGGKIADPLERKAYFDWLHKLEYELFGIPKPDLNIILHVDAEVAQKLVDQKGHRDYVGGEKRDIHEADLNHLKNAEQVYLEIARTFPGFSLIECTHNNEIMSRQEISWLVWEEVTKLLTKSNKYLGKQLGREEALKLKVERLHPAAKLPTRAYEHDAGLDLYANDFYTILPGEKTLIRTGIRMAIPTGHAGLIWDKSGVAKNGIHTTAGVIDSNYRGEIIICLINLSGDNYYVAPGEKIAQILIQKIESPLIIEDIVDDKTERNINNFGSSGLS